MNNKFQAFREFFYIYGWAILIILIALGVLFYLGVFNKDKINNTTTTTSLNIKFNPSIDTCIKTKLNICNFSKYEDDKNFWCCLTNKEGLCGRLSVDNCMEWVRHIKIENNETMIIK